jgi:very-short-patch-repair endonuclease/predicted transcriptional regulator of viral defense system
MADRRLDEKIARLAARQHGVVTRQQLLAMGLGRGGVRARTDRGLLHVIHAGVYLVGHTGRAPLAAEMAAVLACGKGAAISHRSAAPFWTLAHRFAIEHVEVTVPGFRLPKRAGIRAYGVRELPLEDVRVVEQIRVTNPARTILDIGRFLGVDQLEHVVADAERRGLVRRRDLIEQVERNRGRPGVTKLRAVISEGTPAFTRSRAERRLLTLLRRSSLPSPITNARVGRHEVDFLWPHERVIVEVDGFQWHSDRAAFERDRVRDAELQALGYRVIRVTWRQLAREPRAVIARIAATLRRSVDLSSVG